MAHVKGTNSGLWMPQSTHEKIDSQKMFVENMEQHEANYTEFAGRIHAQVDSISKLKALDVSTSATTIKAGTVVMVNGVGLFYYNPSSTASADDEEVIKPITGTGRWVLSGGGGNLIVDEADYGEDTDSDKSGVVLKIKKLFNKKTKTNFFPVTTTKAVRDTSTGKSLFQLLGIIPTMEDSSESGGAEVRDADTVGGISADEFAKKSDYNGIICILLADKWVAQSDGSYIYRVVHPSLTGSEFFDVNLYDDGSATQEQIDAFNELVARIDVNSGEILIKALEKPTVTFSIILRGMCTVDETVVVNLSDVMERMNSLPRFNPVNVTEHAVTNSTAIANTGVGISVPKGSYYSLTFVAMYEISQPELISINTSQTDYNIGILGTAIKGHNHCSCTVSGYAEDNTTLYLWAKYNGATSNRFMIKGFYITME